MLRVATRIGCALFVGCLALADVRDALAQSGSRRQGSGTRVAPTYSGTPTAPRGTPGSTTRQNYPSALQGNAPAERADTRSTPTGSGSRVPVVNEPFEDRFWSYLQRGRYRNWAPVSGAGDGVYPGESPHGAFLKMYLNRKAAGNPTELPHGSVIIKENYGSDAKTLMAITVMYRVKDYNAEAGDWLWIKYNPDGSVASAPTGMKLAGKVAGCIDCHSGADGNDYSFFNDSL